jgi:hypothetical protein
LSRAHGKRRVGVGPRRGSAWRRSGATIALAMASSAAALAAGHGARHGADHLTYHGTPQRTGWYDGERALTPASVSSPAFGQLWESAPLDAANGTPARLFASPLYVDRVAIADPAGTRRVHSVVFAASTTGYVYAINAFRAGAVEPGTVLWRTRLTATPCARATYGILGTPVIDPRRQRIYVTACETDRGWRVHALDLSSGREAQGWPLPIDADAVNGPGVNANGANRFPAGVANLQRGALNLSPDRSRLFVTFGGEPISGWLLAIDTQRARIVSAFSASAATDEGVGGMWSAGGPAVDARGDVYVATGSSVVNTLAGKGIAGVYPDSAGNWGQSVLRLSIGRSAGFRLTGTYTPFNYCQSGAQDIDLGSGSPVLVDLRAGESLTPRLLALGGTKQGNAYLLDRDHMPGSLVRRQPCADDPAQDGSLLAPDPQPHFGTRGPLNVFGPYTDRFGMGDRAKSRSTPAYFRSAAGERYLFLTGGNRPAEDSGVSIAPSVVRLRIEARPGAPAYLRIDRTNPDLVLQNPGSPFVSSNGGHDGIVWILDPNKPRTAALYGADAPQPVLYALDAQTLQLLWKSAPGQLGTSGKYNEPIVSRGIVFVGTDRIQAFGLRGG